MAFPNVWDKVTKLAIKRSTICYEDILPLRLLWFVRFPHICDPAVLFDAVKSQNSEDVRIYQS